MQRSGGEQGSVHWRKRKEAGEVVAQCVRGR